MNRDDYIFTRKANGDARTVIELGAEFDALAASLAPPPPDKAVLAVAVKRSTDVNAALVALRDSADKTKRARFDSLRLLSFEQQAGELGL